MTTKPNAVIPAEEPKRKKRGGQPGNTNAPVPVGLAGVGSSMASTPKTSPLPNAGACTQRVLFEQVTKGVVLGDEIALLRVLIRRSS